MNLYSLLLAAAADATTTVTSATEEINLMNSTLTFGERIALGLELVLFGMAVVFAVLILIWAILAIFKVIFYDVPNRKKAEETPAEVTAATEIPAPQDVAEMLAEEPQPDESELVAAITAALAVVMDKPQTSFRVVSFRRSATK